MSTGKFYITTPIFYVNDKPHIGHAYTMVIADVLARWHRLKGEDVFFLTGTDEHGEKIEKYAQNAGKSPKEFVDEVVQKFKDAWSKLNISYDYFIRTTDEKHQKIVQRFVSELIKKGKIYKGEYEGWYCFYDETFLTEKELKDGKCPYCNRPVEKIKEESYFFKLSEFQQTLLDLYDKNRSFLSPNFRAQEIINRVKEGLKDLSISRTTVKWAVPFPDDDKHFIYVWLDALLNYLSAIDWPDGDKFKKFWPADVHIIGKEISWFHCVIWPALLIANDIPTPKMVFSHGWWTVDGKKMSKSFGNVVDPIEILSKYKSDELRYFLIREVPIGQDGDFSEASLKNRINGELLSDLGNLVSRVLKLSENSKVEIKGDVLIQPIDVDKIDNLIKEIKLTDALDEIMSFIRRLNKFIDEKEPWKLKGEELGQILYNLLESLRIISILIYPFMPETAQKMADQLGTKITGIYDCKFKPFDGKVSRGEHLFSPVK